MTWLSGKARRILSVGWPANDADINALEGHYSPPGLSSVLDDQVIRAIVHQQDSTSLYLARIYEAIANGDDQVIFNKFAVLPYIAHRVALLPNRSGFTSLEFNKETSSVTLRIHDWNGSVLKERSTHATAAYGRLVVEGDLVGICVSSGQDPPDDMELDGIPAASCRVDYYFTSEVDHDAPTGDEIVVWDWKKDKLTHVPIPQDDAAPLRHDASFRFVGQSHIVLGGSLSSAFGIPSALLKSFEITGDFTRTFAHDQNFEMDDDLDVIAQPGSSGHNRVLVNYHHNGNRITIIKNELLDGTVESRPTSDDPPGLHQFCSHPGYARTMEGTVNQYLPSISDNRVLIGLRIERDAGLQKFAIGSDRFTQVVLFLCDFHQERCNKLFSLSSTDRTLLEREIKDENENAQLTLVHRNYYISIEDDLDMEWPRFRAPQEWNDHLLALYHTKESRKRGELDTPILEFDEGPAERKETPRLVFTRSVVWLPEDDEYRVVKFSNFSLSSSGIVHVPEPGNRGHVFVFSD